MAVEDFGFGATFRFEVSGTEDMRAAIAATRLMQAQLRDMIRVETLAGRDTTGFRNAMDRLSVDLGVTSAKLSLISARMQRLSGVTRAAGFAIVVLSGAMTAIGGFGLSIFSDAVEKAIEFEAAMKALTIRARITSQAVVDDLGRSFKRLSEILPGTAIDMAKAGEVIAKTGTAIADIPSVVQEAITLSVSEGTRAADAANLLSRSMRAFAQDLDRFGTEKAAKFNSALIAISDSVAATATEVADAGRRAGNMGTAFGLATPQILAYVAAVKDAGVTTQVSGTAVQALFKELTALTPEKIQALGLTVNDLARIKPEELIRRFAVQLGNFTRDGNAGAALRFLKVFGLDARRTTQAMLALGNAATQVVGRSEETGQAITRLDQILLTGVKAFREGTLSQERLEQQLETLSRRLEQLRSIWTSLKISFGDALTPLISFVTSGLKIILSAFNALPEPVKKLIAVTAVLFLGIIAGVGAVMAALGGLVLLASSAFFGLQLAGVSVADAMAGIQNGLRLVGAAFTDATARGELFARLSTKMAPLRASLAGMRTQIRNIGLSSPLLIPLVRGFDFTGLAVRKLLGQVRSIVPVLFRIVAFFVGGPLGLVVAATVGVVIAGARRAMNKAEAEAKERGFGLIETFVEIFRTAETSVKQLDFLESIGLGPLATLIGQLGFLVDEFVLGFKEAFSDVPGFFKDIFGVSVDSFGELIDFIFDEVISPIKQALTDLGVSLGIFSPEEQNKGLKVMKAIGTVVGFLVGSFVQLIRIVGLAVSTILRWGVNVALFFIRLPVRIIRAIDGALDAVSSFIDSIFTKILNKVSEVSAAIADNGVFGKLLSGVLDFSVSILGGPDRTPTPVQAAGETAIPGPTPIFTFVPQTAPAASVGQGPLNFSASLNTQVNLDGVRVGQGLDNVGSRNASRRHVARPPQTQGGL